MARYVEMPDIQSNKPVQYHEKQVGSPCEKDIFLDEDGLMEAILENINSTPIGRVLKNIGSLPEVRKGKVLNLRSQIHDGTYDVSDRLDSVLDKVLEDLTTQS